MARSLRLFFCVGIATFSLTNPTLLKAGFDDISEEIIAGHIAPFLSIKDVNNWGLTCKRFHDAFNPAEENPGSLQNTLWKFYYKRDIASKFSGEKDVENWKTVLKSVAFLQKIPNQGYISDQDQLNFVLSGIKEDSGLFYLLKATLIKTKNPQEAFGLYQSADQNGNKEARRAINKALYCGKLGQKERSEKDRFEELCTREAAGDKDAQMYINQALYNGKLGQDEKSGKDRFEELRKREAAGDKDAQKFVNKALYHGGLGQDEKSEALRFEELSKRANAGDQNAQEFVNEALYFGNLGQKERSGPERFKELSKRAAAGDNNAREYVNQALYKGTLGQKEKQKAERFEELCERAAAGDNNAQKFVNEALYYGTLGQKKRPGKDRFEELRKREAAGDENAQKFVNEALYGVMLGQDEESEAIRFEELRKREAVGDRDAKKYITNALFLGKLGPAEPQNQYAALCTIAAAGIEKAVNEVLYEKKLGQDAKSETMRFKELIIRATNGDMDAKKLIKSAFNQHQKGSNAEKLYLQIFKFLKIFGVYQ